MHDSDMRQPSTVHTPLICWNSRSNHDPRQHRLPADSAELPRNQPLGLILGVAIAPQKIDVNWPSIRYRDPVHYNLDIWAACAEC